MLDTRSTMRLSIEQTNKIVGLYTAAYALTLCASPDFFFGPDSLTPYFTRAVFDTVTLYFARGVGVSLFAIAYGCWADPRSKTVAKMTTLTLAGFLPLFAMCAMDKSGVYLTNAWLFQIIIHSPVTYIAYMAGFGSDMSKMEKKST